PASASVWQPPQFPRNIDLPFVGLPLRWKAATIGNFFTLTVQSGVQRCGVGALTPCDWQAASTEAPRRTAAMRVIRRTGRDSNEALRPAVRGPVAQAPG